MSQINDCIDRFTRKNFGRFNYFARRADYGIKFEFFRIVYESLNRRGREQYGYLFKYTFNVCGSCAEFKSIGYRVKFSCYLRDFRIHVKLGFAYDTVNKVLCQIYDRIDGFARKDFGRFNYFARRADYGIEFQVACNVYEVNEQFALIEFAKLFVYLGEYCVFKVERIRNAFDIGHKFVDRRLPVGQFERVKLAADRVA